MHYGIDLAAPTGTPVQAAHDGVVVSAKYQGGYGNCIVIENNSGVITRYAHLHKIFVNENQIVHAKEIIGSVGKTGNVRGRYDASHLHFEIIVNGYHYDPLFYLM